jgi:hypothetical protein
VDINLLIELCQKITGQRHTLWCNGDRKLREVILLGSRVGDGLQLNIPNPALKQELK